MNGIVGLEVGLEVLLLWLHSVSDITFEFAYL